MANSAGENAGTALMDIWQGVKAALEAGSVPGAAFNRPVLATRGLDGAPQARTVILRQADMTSGLLRFHTDARTAKCAEIRAFPCVNVLGYDPADEVQLRLKGEARVHAGDGVARAAFEGAPAPSLRAYLAEAAPGTGRGAPGTGLPEDVEGLVPSRARLEAGWPHFAVILAEICEIDWLKLAREGNRRARFTRTETGWEGEWRQP